MLVGPGDFERLKKVPETDLKIGTGAKGQVDSLRTESRDLNRKIADLKVHQGEIDRIRQVVRRLSSPETLRLLLGFMDQLNEALAEKELASQRISGRTSAEYQAICDSLSALKLRKPQAEEHAQTARDAAGRTKPVMEDLQGASAKHLRVLQGKRSSTE